ncbi:hypothetical protein LshimejAT787_1800260 [Lyophyllum shimeji]|uniref:Uncharacterized protein n=1 Tax=Lyophyllum shimeji TaxID=47721 RepID=A0A9P3PZY2_LYOSH|nr:hypothetical protein LshimejAT787_1800260 [Lyophyllum shimeji]
MVRSRAENRGIERELGHCFVPLNFLQVDRDLCGGVHRSGTWTAPGSISVFLFLFYDSHLLWRPQLPQMARGRMRQAI